MRFVLDEVLRLNEEDGSTLDGRVDPERIGAGGLSLGGITTYGYVFSDGDERIDATALFDTARVEIDGATIDLSTDLPKLFVHADGDFALPYQDTLEAYTESAPPKWFITLHEEVHASPFEDDPDPADEIVTAASIAFWDLYLRDDDGASDGIEDAVAADPALATLEFEPAEA
jgi:dienelactone hydrolase